MRGKKARPSQVFANAQDIPYSGIRVAAPDKRRRYAVNRRGWNMTKIIARPWMASLRLRKIASK
jgi:hypothetical protein